MVERETLVEAAIAVVVVLLFIAVVVAAGVMFGGDSLAPAGAYTIVGAIALFVVGMAIMGYWLAGRYD